MVILFLANQLQLKDDATHISTMFQLSDTMNFSNILAESDSTVNKHAVLFDIDLDPSVKYYARAQALLTTGWTKHANLDVVEVKLSGLTGYMTSVLPSKISTPILFTDSPQNGHALTNFTIEAKGFNRVGTSKHNKTIYFITDSIGRLMWYRITEMELNTIKVSDILLEEDAIYKVHAIFGSSSNDHSQVASMTIVTGGNKNLHLLSDSTYSRNQDVTLTFMKVDGVTEINYELLEYSDNRYNIVKTGKFNGIVGSIDKSNFDKNLYLLKARSNLDTSDKNFILQITD